MGNMKKPSHGTHSRCFRSLGMVRDLEEGAEEQHEVQCDKWSCLFSITGT